MKTIARKIIAIAIVVSGVIFSDSAMAACNKPTVMSTTAITPSAATFNWNSVSGALNYNIRYRVVSTSTWTTVNAITVLNYSASGLISGTGYEWQAQTRCSATQTSSWTASNTFSTLACVIPSGLNATGITAFDATLNWTAVSGAAGYNVQYRIVGEPSWTSTTSTTASVSVSSLSPVSNYEFQVQTNCGGSNLSAFSSSATFTTLVVPCNVPTSLTVSGITSDFATLDWDDMQYAVGYNAQYRQVGSSTWISIPDQGGSSADISGLLPSTNYEWQVQTDCGNSNTSAFSSSVSFTTSQILCTTPVSLTVMDLTTTTATLKWDAVAGAAGYNVEYRAVGAPSWTVTSTTATNVPLSSLTPGATYEWKVQTDCGSSNFSAFSTVTAFAALMPVCYEPYDVNFTNITDHSATVIWAEQRNQSGYNVEYREIGSSTWNTLTTTANSVVISSLNPSASYEVQVQTNCGNSNLSTFSSAVLLVTATPVSCTDVPSSITASNVAHDAATLSWVSGSNEAMASAYEVQYRELNTSSWTTATSPSTTISISGLNMGTDYEWQVRRSCGVSNSAFSSMGTFTTLSHVAPINTSQYITAIPHLNNPMSWNVIIAGTGNPNLDAQIVHDWLLSHGIIKE